MKNEAPTADKTWVNILKSMGEGRENLLSEYDFFIMHSIESYDRAGAVYASPIADLASFDAQILSCYTGNDRKHIERVTWFMTEKLGRDGEAIVKKESALADPEVKFMFSDPKRIKNINAVPEYVLWNLLIRALVRSFGEKASCIANGFYIYAGSSKTCREEYVFLNISVWEDLSVHADVKTATAAERFPNEKAQYVLSFGESCTARRYLPGKDADDIKGRIVFKKLPWRADSRNTVPFFTLPPKTPGSHQAEDFAESKVGVLLHVRSVFERFYGHLGVHMNFRQVPITATIRTDSVNEKKTDEWLENALAAVPVFVIGSKSEKEWPACQSAVRGVLSSKKPDSAVLNQFRKINVSFIEASDEASLQSALQKDALNLVFIHEKEKYALSGKEDPHRDYEDFAVQHMEYESFLPQKDKKGREKRPDTKSVFYSGVLNALDKYDIMKRHVSSFDCSTLPQLLYFYLAVPYRKNDRQEKPLFRYFLMKAQSDGSIEFYEWDAVHRMRNYSVPDFRFHERAFLLLEAESEKEHPFGEDRIRFIISDGEKQEAVFDSPYFPLPDPDETWKRHLLNEAGKETDGSMQKGDVRERHLGGLINVSAAQINGETFYFSGRRGCGFNQNVERAPSFRRVMKIGESGELSECGKDSIMARILPAMFAKNVGLNRMSAYPFHIKLLREYGQLQIHKSGAKLWNE